MSRWVLILVVLGFTALALACGKKEETPPAPKPVTEKQVKEQAQQALETLKTFTQQQKEAYQQKVSDQLAEMHKKLEGLKLQVAKAAPEVKARLEKELAEHQQDFDTLQKDLAELKTSTGKAWDELKSSIIQLQEKGQKSAEPEKPDK